MISPADTVASRLWRHVSGGGPADLSSHLVLVPTAQAGRLLRRSLQRLADETSRPLQAPSVLTPEEYVARFLETLPTATPLDSLAALAGVLREARPGQFAALFPRLPDLSSHPLALACAESLLALRATLGENGLDASGVLARLPPGHPENARWADLARLEQAFRAVLASHSLVDREDARARLLGQTAPVVPCGIIWMAFLPDPQPLLISHLRGLGPAPEIRLIPFADHAAGSLDEWGRALPAAWAERAPAWDDFGGRTHLIATPEDALPWLLARAAGQAPPPGRVTVGLLTPDLLPPLREAFQACGSGLHDPAGRPFPLHWLGQLLTLAADCAEDPAYRLLPRLLTFPAVAAWVGREIAGFSLTQTLEGLDQIGQRHLPDTLDDALATRENRLPAASSPENTPASQAEAFLRLIAAWRTRLLEAPPWPGETSSPSAAEVLHAWLEELQNLLPSGSDPYRESAWELLSQRLLQLPEISRRHRVASAADQIRLILRGLAQATLPEPPSSGSVPALGWLELLWDEAPHLILAGVNEGLVPASPAPDPFLPDSLRTLLGLRDRASRHARDTAILDTLLRLRSSATASDLKSGNPGLNSLSVPGRVDCLILQTAANGDPQRPSRLLLQGAGQELPGRVLRLFREPSPAAPEPAWQAGWKLSPSLASVRPEKRLSVTDFKAYLDCPFRFFLRKHLRMEDFDAAKAELDARDFGDLLHHVLEAFGKDAEACEMDDPDDIQAWTEHRLRQRVRRVYGETLPLAVLVQQEAAVSRLQGFARHQAALRAEGWRILAVERSFEQTLGHAWLLDGWEIRGRFDRLDQHADGRHRVIDYKTADKPLTPALAHWSRPRAEDPWPPDYARGSHLGERGKEVPHLWTNLQLPLYVELLASAGLPGETISAAYFNLPKALGEAGVEDFSELTPALRAAAVSCARGVLADLGSNRFWPPREKPDHDDHALMLTPSPQAVVDPSGMLCS